MSAVRVGCLAVLSALLLGGPALAQQQDLPLDDVAELERISRLLEAHGAESLSLEHLSPPLPDGLRFEVDGNTEERERAFHAAWLDAYQGICEAIIDQGGELCGDKLRERDREKAHPKRLKAVLKALKKLARKDPAAAEAQALLRGMLATYEQVLLARQGEDVDALILQRRADADAFLKRYDFGPQIATAKRHGTAVIEVQLPPETWNLVRGELDSWRYTPLEDGEGNQVQLQGMNVEWGEQLNQGMVREALDRLAKLEYFTVRYAEVKNELPTGEFARVTGARLTLGTYYFFQYGDRFMVFRGGDR